MMLLRMVVLVYLKVLVPKDIFLFYFFSLTLLEARSPKSRCWQGWFLLRALRKKLSVPVS